MIDYEVLVTLGIAAFIMAKLWETVKLRLGSRWESLTDGQKELCGYGMIVLSAGAVWLTALNAFPGFSVIWGPFGRVLTCVFGGFGPSVVYDVWLDRPTPPTS